MEKMNKKISKFEAEYRDHPKGMQWCERCSMFREPDDCTLVLKGRSGISAKGWCKFYEAKK